MNKYLCTTRQACRIRKSYQEKGKGKNRHIIIIIITTTIIVMIIVMDLFDRKKAGEGKLGGEEKRGGGFVPEEGERSAVSCKPAHLTPTTTVQ